MPPLFLENLNDLEFALHLPCFKIRDHLDKKVCKKKFIFSCPLLKMPSFHLVNRCSCIFFRFMS